MRQPERSIDESGETSIPRPRKKDEADRAGQREGGRKLRVIDKAALAELFDRSLERALAAHEGSIRRSLGGALHSHARGYFLRSLRQGGRRVRGMTREEFLRQLEASRDGICAARDKARVELESLRDRLAGVRERRADGEELLAREREQDLARVSAEVEAILRSGGGEAPESLARRIAEAAVESLDAKRRKVFALGRAEHDREVDVLERRIRKLKGSLTKAETALVELEKGGEEGVASIFRTVQGLSTDDDGDRVAILEQIYAWNLELQSHLPGPPDARAEPPAEPDRP